jgi:hypothetical protein
LSLDNVQQLRKDRERLQQQVDFIIDQLGTLGPELTKKKLTDCRAQLFELDQLIKNTDAPRHRPVSDPEKLVSSLLAQLDDLNGSFDKLPMPSLRRLLGLLISRLTVDLETREIEMELALPSAVVMDSAPNNLTMCLDDSMACLTGIEAHGEMVPLSRFSCSYGQPLSPIHHGLKAKGCFKCSRHALAA